MDTVMGEKDKRMRGSLSTEGKWARKRPGRCKYCLTRASRILGLLLVLQVSFGLLALDEQLREAPPPPAMCLMSGSQGAPFERLKLLADEELSREILDMSSHSSVVLKYITDEASAAKQDPAPVAHQMGFESICDGWCNGYRRNSKPQAGFWTYDTDRGALVAKHIYHDAQEATGVNPRSARLLSPVFEAPPAYHSWPNSSLVGTCSLSFRYYHTGSSLQLDVNLFKPRTRQAARQTIPMACEPRMKLLLSSKTWSDDETIFQRSKGIHSSSLEAVSTTTTTTTTSNHISDAEKSLWQTVVLKLPESLNTSYAIEFFTFGVQLEANIDKPIGEHYLHGIALANITLSPECFGLNVNTTEAERVRLLAEAKSYAEFGWLDRLREYVSEFWEHHLLYIVVVGGIVLCLMICMLMHLWCNYVDALKTATSMKIEANNKRGGRAKRCLYGWLQWPATGRDRVYADGGSSGRLRQHQHQHQIQLKSQQENLRQFLQPLRAPLDGVEMAENPGYLSKQLADKHSNTTYENTTPINGTMHTANSPSNGTGRGLDLMMQNNDVERACDRILQPYYIDRSRLTITEELGNGAFGRVYQGCLICYCDKTNDSACETMADNCADTHSIKVAVKTLTDQRMGRREFVQEAANMALVSHRNIVELLGVCFERQPMFIVMELLTGGNLKDFLIKNRDHGTAAGHTGPLWSPASILSLAGASLHQQQQDHYCLLQSSSGQPSPQAGFSAPPTQSLCMGDLLVFGLDVARACDYLQRRNFIHRDLAARNCLVSAAHKALSLRHYKHEPWRSPSPVDPAEQHSHPLPHQHKPRNVQTGGPPSALQVGANHKVDLDEVFVNGYQNSQLVVKLADFGMTRDIYAHHYYRLGRREMPVRWMPPECLDGIATSKSDVWSFGVLLWELFSMGQQPYQELANPQVIELLKSRRHARPPVPSPSTAAPDSNSNYDQPLLILDAAERTPEPARPKPDTVKPLPEPQLEPPLPPPHDNTPHPVYAIMCACWAANQDDRPQFDEIANRLYWCTQMPQVLNTALPQFWGPAANTRPPSLVENHVYATGVPVTGESGLASGATTQLTQLNWGPTQ